MSQSATPATQNDMTTCLETFEKERFCSFPHRHGDATGKPETRDKTRRNIKTSISCETSSNLHGDATRKPEIRDETRGNTKTSISCETSANFHTLSLQIDVFLRVFVGTSKFCNFKIDVSCEASVNVQHMSQNVMLAMEFAPCRRLTQPCQCDLQKTRNTTRLKCCACHEK